MHTRVTIAAFRRHRAAARGCNNEPARSATHHAQFLRERFQIKLRGDVSLSPSAAKRERRERGAPAGCNPEPEAGGSPGGAALLRERRARVRWQRGAAAAAKHQSFLLHHPTPPAAGVELLFSPEWHVPGKPGSRGMGAGSWPSPGAAICSRAAQPLPAPGPRAAPLARPDPKPAL